MATPRPATREALRDALDENVPAAFRRVGRHRVGQLIEAMGDSEWSAVIEFIADDVADSLGLPDRI